jgi:hypothetical protein
MLVYQRVTNIKHFWDTRPKGRRRILVEGRLLGAEAHLRKRSPVPKMFDLHDLLFSWGSLNYTFDFLHMMNYDDANMTYVKVAYIYIWWIMMIYADMTYVKAPCEKLWKYLLSSAHISLDLDRDDWDRLRPSPSPTWLPRHGQAVDAFQSALQKTLGVGRIILFSWCNKSLSYLITILYITLHKYAILYSILASNYQWPVLDSQWLSAGFSMPACQTHAPCNLFNEWSSSSIPLATLLHASTILQSIAKLEQMIKPFLHFIWGIHLLLGGFLDFEVTVI